MTSINAGLNPYTQLGSAYARAAATQPSLAGVAERRRFRQSARQQCGDQSDTVGCRPRAAGRRGRVKRVSRTVTSDARAALDASLYRCQGERPDRRRRQDDDRPVFVRSPFAVCYRLPTMAASSASTNRRRPIPNSAIASSMMPWRPPLRRQKLTGDFSSLYKAALDYLDGASGEEKATGDVVCTSLGGAKGRSGHPAGSDHRAGEYRERSRRVPIWRRTPVTAAPPTAEYFKRRPESPRRARRAGEGRHRRR